MAIQALYVRLFVLIWSLWITSVSGSDCNTVFRNSPTFQNCQYRCHCKGDIQCNQTTGECDSGCVFGWMGPGCQYRNIAKNNTGTRNEGGTDISADYALNAVDGDVNTCARTEWQPPNTNHYWRIQWDRDYRIVGLVVKFHPDDVNAFNTFRVETGTGPNNGDFTSVCYRHENRPGIPEMEIMCRQPVWTSNLRIILDKANTTLRLCEVEIYGGRDVTFNKPTNQSSTYATANSSLSVDGQPDVSVINFEDTCSTTGAGEKNPYWLVDFVDEYVVQSVYFYSRLGNGYVQYSGYKVTLLNASSGGKEIFKELGSDADQNQPMVIELDDQITARYLKVERPPDKTILTVCEIVTFAECPLHKCSWDCTTDCHCVAETTGTYQKDGNCPYGCSGRWTGVDRKCNIECNITEWGNQCLYNCGHFYKDEPCDDVTGHCEHGCNGPQLPPECTQKCNNTTYGVNCTQACGHCKDDSSCNISSGHCLEGCDSGWQPSLCQEACAPGTYGDGCTKNCGVCLQRTPCLPETGFCEHGCDPGYQTMFCNATCDSGWYGLNCSGECGRCNNENPCNATNGECDGECQQGWQTIYCNKTCDPGKYGEGCASDCGNCSEVESCNHTTGHCENGCAAGFKGVLCNTTCDDGNYGTNCIEKCGHCNNTADCNKETGVCSNGCLPGWINATCKSPCDPGKYGERCASDCGNCSDLDYCNHSTGHCENGCAAGFKGEFCKTSCDDGTYGTNCTEECGHCNNTVDCNKETGVCSSGCLPGWKNETCITPCYPGKYGVGCASNCGDCFGGDSCNHTTGHCENGCAPGFNGVLCNTTCGDGNYGANCYERCGHCNNTADCNKETGVCSSDCLPGWISATCKIHGDTCNDTIGECKSYELGHIESIYTEACDNGTYGHNCTQTCGRCADNTQCNITSGDCHGGCGAGYEGPQCQKVSKMLDENPETSSAGMIIGVLVGVLVVGGAGCAAAILILRRRNMQTKLRNSEVENMSTFTSSTVIQDEEREPVIDPNDVNVYNNSCVKRNTIEVSDLRQLCVSAKRSPDALYREFEDLPYGMKLNASEARNPKFKSKNRYRDMYPYNETRVHLPEIPGDELSTYINASYINGYAVSKKYIAAQGAMDTTTSDMWRLVWSKNVSTVVMLTNCVELGKLKCVKYWPDEGTEIFGDISVELVKSESYSDFIIRTFECIKVRSGEKREVLQFHYTAWPDKDVPDTALSLVQFWRTVRYNQASKAFPWIVHCSAGVGRTGTFIALDFLYEMGTAECVVNIQDTVNTLREQRLNMVQTKEQYVYVHETVAEALTPIGSVCRNNDFPEMFQSLFHDNGKPKQKLIKEFEDVNTYKIEVEDPLDDEDVYCNVFRSQSADSKLEENLEKSRDMEITPADIHRPRLSMVVMGRNDFINASYIPTFRNRNRLILTQVPLENTIVDFLRMIWEYNLKIVVLLEDTLPEKCSYLPTTTKSKQIGIFTSELMNERVEDCYVRRRIVLTLNGRTEQKEFHQFHFKSWPQNKSTPIDTGSVLRLISDIENNSNSRGHESIVVQCLNGATKSGVFSTLWCLLEKAKSDNEIAVAETVRMSRMRRKQIIENFEQYKYCYNVLRDYLDSFNVYANAF